MFGEWISNYTHTHSSYTSIFCWGINCVIIPAPMVFTTAACVITIGLWNCPSQLKIDFLGPSPLGASGGWPKLWTWPKRSHWKHFIGHTWWLIRQEKGAQTQSFWSGYLWVGWGSSSRIPLGGVGVVFQLNGWGQKVWYLFRNLGKPKCWAGYPGIWPGYPGRLRPKSLRKQIVFNFWPLVLRVVFPLRGPGKPPGRKYPKNGEKLQNSPPQSDPRKWGKIAPKITKIVFSEWFYPFLGQFSPFSGVGPGRPIL